MGRAQLTGGVELTVGDKLTGGETRLLTRPIEAAMPVYIEVKLMVRPINQSINNQQVNIVQSPSGRMDTGHWTGRYLQ